MPNYKTKSGKQIRLTSANFVGKGGQASVFKHKGVAYKIGNVPAEGKIKELAPLSKNESICAPQEALFDKGDRLVGFSMRLIDSKYVWASLITNEFKAQHNPNIPDLSHQVFDIARYTHSHSCIIVDANEMNFLIDHNDKVVAVDVDSWGTKNYRADAIAPSIADYRRSDFCKETDWYSLAVLTFQAFCNIHPYRGKCDGYNGKIIDKIKARRANLVSVLNPKVRVPDNVPDFSSIPKNLYRWYYDIFENGDYREAPTSFDITEPQKKKVLGCKLDLTPTTFSPPETITVNSELSFEFVFDKYGFLNGSLYELDNINNKTMSRKIRDLINPSFYRDVACQNVFGEYSFFYNGNYYSLPEVKNHRVLDAKYSGKVLGVSSYFDGEYYLQFFKDGVLAYCEKDMSPMPVNFCYLDKGVTIFKLFNNLVMFTGNNSKELVDVSLPVGSELYSKQDDVIILSEGSYYHAKIK